MKQPDNFKQFQSDLGVTAQTGSAFRSFNRLFSDSPIKLVAALMLVSAAYIYELPAGAQLPPVNMGKYVHQPGDNQYSNSTQQERHGAPVQMTRPVQQQIQVIPNQEPVWRPTPKAIRPDPSLEPIVCDEPISPAGFPPIPEQLDVIGVRPSGGAMPLIGGGGGGGMGGGGENYSSSYQGSAPGLGGNNSSQPHAAQGYTTFTPGAFVPKKSVYGGGNNSGPTGKGSTEFYSSGDGAGKKPAMSAGDAQMRAMGNEPALGKGSGGAPEAPQAVEINQPTTQDLSLPDDQTEARNQTRSNSQSGRMVKQMGRQMQRQVTRSLYRGMSSFVRFPK